MPQRLVIPCQKCHVGNPALPVHMAADGSLLCVNCDPQPVRRRNDQADALRRVLASARLSAAASRRNGHDLTPVVRPAHRHTAVGRQSGGSQ